MTPKYSGEDKEPINANIQDHIVSTANPHSVTKSQVGLANVDNTSDAAKPVSTATQTALDLKAPLASPAFTGTPTGITKAHVSLGNVDNTSDADKPVSTAQQTALNAKEDDANKGAANGYAPLGADSLVPLANLPTLGVGDVVGPTVAVDNRVVFFDGITGKLIKDSGLLLSGSNTGDQTLPTDATITTTDVTTNNATTAKHGWMPKGTGSTSTFFRSDMTQAAPTASVAITEAEIDVGATPVSEATISVTDAGISTSSKIIGGLAYIAPTGKDLDELEMDALDIKFEPATGSMNVIIKGLEGYIADKFKIWYTFA